MRTRITKELIEHHQFAFVAIEGDWPDAARIDQYVRYSAAPASESTAFARFPSWLWRNQEVEEFVEWLRSRNVGLAPKEMAAVHGLDLCSLYTSIQAALDYLDSIDPDAARAARQRYGCLDPWQEQPAVNGQAAVTGQHHLLNFTARRAKASSGPTIPMSAIPRRPTWARAANSISATSVGANSALHASRSASARTMERWPRPPIGTSRCRSRPSARRCKAATNPCAIRPKCGNQRLGQQPHGGVECQKRYQGPGIQSYHLVPLTSTGSRRLGVPIERRARPRVSPPGVCARGAWLRSR